MSSVILIFFWVFFAIRLSTLRISAKNEKRIKQSGAQEYGQRNSIVLALLHLAFYLGAFVEGYLTKVQFDQVTIVGMVIYVFAIVMLFYVIQQLSPIWTVKLIIGEEHPLNQGFLFRHIKHPNYFLNIIPELIGLALIMKARVVFLTIFPIYLISLAIRIKQEEKAMTSRFANY